MLAFVSIKWALTPVFAHFIPSNDETQISTLLGWHAMMLPFLVMIPGLLILTFLVKQHLKRSSWLPLTLVPVCGGLGAGTWVDVLGPLILGS